MTASFVQSVWTVIAFVFFVGVVFWAWSGARKQDFEQAARMPLEDDNETTNTQKQE
jgi:cytochrome c oxidase cbb3-type subunit 4